MNLPRNLLLRQMLAQWLMQLILESYDFAWHNLPQDSQQKVKKSIELKSKDSSVTLKCSVRRAKRSSSAAVSLARLMPASRSSEYVGMYLRFWTDVPRAEIEVRSYSPSSLGPRFPHSLHSTELEVSPSNSREPLKLSSRHSPTTGYPSGSVSTDSEDPINRALFELLPLLLEQPSIRAFLLDFAERRTGTET